MSLSTIILSAAAVLLAAVTALAFMLLGLRRERAQLAVILDAGAGASLAEVAAAMARLAREGAGAAALTTRLKQLLGACPEPVLLLDESRTIVDLSNRAEADLDQPRRRRGLLESLGSHELDEAARHAMETMASGELTVRLYAHGRRPFLARVFPFRAGGGAECVIFLQDVSASFKFGELRSQFAATVSHELRTPLAGIRALVESLQDPDIEPQDAARFLARVDEETSRLSQLIEEILFLSSLESGAVESLRGETALDSLVAHITAEKEPLARKREVSVAAQVPEGLILPLNERMAATVLTNLLDNAIKYSGRGSRVEVSAAREGNSLRVTVRDDGIGIDAEHLPHIFERFYRVDKSRSRRLGGTGLGLSIVKHIVESAGGEIRVQSREGFGTQMTIILPLVP